MLAPEDEKVGSYYIRARAVKGVWASVVNRNGVREKLLEGFDSEEAALEAARAWARENAPARPAPGSGAKRALSAERRSIDELRAKFVKHFPQGFTDPAYIAAERDYKDKARAQLLSACPLADAASADAARSSAIRAAFDTNMVSPFEKMRVRKVLDSAEGPAFVHGAALLAQGDAKAGLAAVDAAVRVHGPPSWTIATYLPALWAPETSMLMRITATVRVANWLSHDFAAKYNGALDADIHASFLDFAQALKKSLAPMAPRDLIDVQSFIWVVSEYD